MALDAKQRRALIARSQELKALATVSAGRDLDRAAEHVRAVLERHELAKVRIRADDRLACDAAAAKLAETLSAEVVTRIGRVVLLYRPKSVVEPA